MNKTPGTGLLVLMGVLLFLASFVGPLVAEFKVCAEYHYMPDKPRLVYAVLVGISSGLATVIAYLNTGYARWKDKRNGNVTTEQARS